jgi:hypothetical protein
MKMKQYSIGCMLLLLVLIVLFGISTQYRDGFMDDQGSDDQGEDQGSDQGDDQGSDQSSDMDDQDSMDSSMSSMSSLRRQLPPMVSSCVKDGLRQFDDLQ